MIKLEYNKSNGTYKISGNIQGKKIMSLDEKIQKLIKSTLAHAKMSMEDNRFYPSINESVKNDIFSNVYGKAYGLTIEQAPDGFDNHFLILNLLNPKMTCQSTRTLTYGKKEDIIKFLENENFAQNLKTQLLEMSENMQNR